MNRLTTKIKGSNNYCEFELKNAKYKDLFELSSNREIEDYVNTDLTIAIDKLGKLEDIEEELGIDIQNDLSKLLQASKNGFWVKKEYTNIKTHRKEYQFVFYEYAYFYYASDTECWWIATIDSSYALYQYKITWALTKEELEND